MQELLRGIDGVLGVGGSFLCDPEGAIVASTLPGETNPATVSAVARTFNRTFEGLRLARRRKVQEMDLVFEKGRLVVKSLPGGCLVIACAPTINVQLLNMTVNLVVRQLSQHLVPRVEEVAAPPAAAHAPDGVGDAVIEKLRAAIRARMGEHGVDFFDRRMAAAGLNPSSSVALFERMLPDLDVPLVLALGGRAARQLIDEMRQILRSHVG
ncbi:MAG: roadblock/LC7 domain-containing protein [Chloroflexota bacterium]